MISAAIRCAVMSVLVLTAAAVPAREHQLTFAERVAAQEAIERVYYSHQIGAEKSFEEAVPLDLLERKVVKYLKQSAALEEFWYTPVTAEMLERELQRMSRGTRMPERLQEYFAALDNDPVLIHECLARPALVDRLTRNFFAFDHRFHEAVRQEARTIHTALSSGGLDPRQKHPLRTEVEFVQEPGDGPSGIDPRLDENLRVATAPEGPTRLTLSPNEFDAWKDRVPGTSGAVRPVDEDREAFHIRVLLERDDARVRLAAYRVEKTPWDTWWNTISYELDEHEVVNVASPDASIPHEIGGTGRGGDPCAEDDTWDNGSFDDLSGLPAPRWHHTAVWTGSLMLVWGGTTPFGSYYVSGGRYDPATDTWTEISTEGAPSPRLSHTAVWTGSLMVVWGNDGQRTGGRYDPATDSWTPTSTAVAPVARREHSAVWTGSHMVVWGGRAWDAPIDYLDTGGRYDPATDTWTRTSTEGAPSPRSNHTAVWTGNLMVVWGGEDDFLNQNTGGRYDPASDTWAGLSTEGAPSGRRYHTAVWTGSQMVIWGGLSNYDPGGRYDPVTDTWTATSTVGAPSPRGHHTAIWTGSHMVVWGGGVSSYLNTGGRYDPATDSWAATSTTGAPAPRRNHSAVWTGSHMVVWGGENGHATGGRYDPVTDSWTPTSTTGVPPHRAWHTAVWTGSHMVVWGGWSGVPLNTGGRYDPATDSWTPTATAGVPPHRAWHTAVWTGNHMVVWGGWSGALLNTGGRYDPVTDTWAATSTTGAPSSRSDHTAVWTGSRMVVWGGYTNTGGRYDPVTDTWAATSTTGAPSSRSDHTAVWTGSRMVIWGGYTNTGGRYDPVTDTWAATSTTGAPSSRSDHTAVWTGSRMVIWGGGNYSNSGGRYDPATDTWAATSTTGAPWGRANHTAVWTGSQMVVWGGVDQTEYHSDKGGRYDPVTDSWTPTSTVDAPAPREDHTAVWTGSFMLVWGGSNNYGFFGTGGRYALGHASDDDADGYTECDGDCNDGNASVYPGAAEVNDGFDNQCPGETGHGTVDEIGSECGFHDPDDPTELSWPAQPGATLYEVARFADPDDPVSCTMTPTADTFVIDPEEPLPGSIFCYLIRALAPHVGSWGQDSAGVERAGVCP